MLWIFFLLYSEPFYTCSLGPLRGSQWPLFARVAETENGEMAGVISDGQQSVFHFFPPTGALLFQKNLPGRAYVDYLRDEQGGSIFLALVSEPDNAETDSETPDADLFFFNTQGSLLYQMHLSLQIYVPSKDHRAFALVNKSRLNAHQDRTDYELYRAADGKKYRQWHRSGWPEWSVPTCHLLAARDSPGQTKAGNGTCLYSLQMGHHPFGGQHFLSHLLRGSGRSMATSRRWQSLAGQQLPNDPLARLWFPLTAEPR
jgi:hypothetical protein